MSRAFVSSSVSSVPVGSGGAVVGSVLALALVGALAGGCMPGDDSFSALAGALSVEPVELVLSPVWAGVGGTAELTLRNRGTAPIGDLVLTIDDAAGVGDWSVVLLADGIAPGAEATALVLLSVPEGSIGVSTATIAITSALDGRLEVPASAAVSPAPSCDDGNPCTQDRFDLELGQCTHEVLTDGVVCDDSSACTTDDRCLMGRCTGAALTCDDGEGCTVDGCDATMGCVFAPVAERCDDDDPCTEDVCTSAEGCQNPPLEQGALCYFDGCTEIGLCFGGQCQLHATPNGVPCEDGDLCTVADVCIDGECRGGPETAVAPGVPVEVRPGALWADLCGGPEDDTWECYAETQVTAIEEVLAVARFPEGVGLVWRGPFTSDYAAACDPTDPQFQPIAIDTPEEEDGDGVPDEPPGGGAARPQSIICASPVFLTLTSGTGEVQWTRQLSAARGAVAAVVEVAATDPLTGVPLGPEIAIASAVFAGDRVLVETYDRGGSQWAPVRDSLPMPFVASGDRIAGVAVAMDAESTFVVAHGGMRTEFLDGDADCAFPGCGSAIAIGSRRVPFAPNQAILSDTLRLNTSAGDLCADPVYLPAPFTVRDLQAAIIDGSAIITFRASPSDCADFDSGLPAENLAISPSIADTAIWRIEFSPGDSDGLEIYSPLAAFTPNAARIEAVGLGAQDGLFAGIWQGSETCCSCDQTEPDPQPNLPDPEPQPPCDCSPSSCDSWSVGLGSGPWDLEAWLTGVGESYNQGVTALRLDGDPSIAFLSGGAVHLLRKAPSDGEVTQLAGEVPSESAWRPEHGLLAASDGSGLVAGRATAIGESPGISVEYALIQEFSCGATNAGNQVACLTDDACESEEHCELEGVCLPSPDCDGSCEPECWGACTADALPDAGPADSGPADSGPADAGPPDAGPADGGPTDAGAPDAGPPDAGGADGGGDAGAGDGADGGPLQDGGDRHDGGESADAGPSGVSGV